MGKFIPLLMPFKHNQCQESPRYNDGAMTHGVPSMAFEQDELAKLIAQKACDYRARRYAPDDSAHAIDRVLEDSNRNEGHSCKALQQGLEVFGLKWISHHLLISPLRVCNISGGTDE